MGVGQKARELCAVACLILATVRPETTFAQSPSPDPRPAVISKLSDCPKGSLKSCFSSSEQMSQYLDIAKPLLTEFFVASYGDNFSKPAIRFVKPGETGLTGCVDQDGPAKFNEDSYFYCGPDNRIYVGQEMMWHLYQDGPIAPALGLAHEWGHHLQKARGVKINSPGKFETSVDRETRADCVAGAWLGYENSKGLFNSEKDEATVSSFVMTIADVESRGHGMDLERLLSFSKGITQALVSCNQYSPGFPISPP